ncbi:MAG: 4Fe-4S binding protein [Verrucomicrobia bacterium]|nr:4Fe-4S binding protein [Verrucomicrobiota bacterium]
MGRLRKIVRIDRDKCDGCGLCVMACAEGALQIVDGKAQLVGEVYCDGLGACLGECPQGAITVEEREAEAFNEAAVQEHLEAHRPYPMPSPQPAPVPSFGGCPGAMARTIKREAPAASSRSGVGAPSQSALANWPVQLHLVPVQAPYLRGARLLIAADCVPVALADFHRELLDGRTLVIGCPKLDDVEAYAGKLAELFRLNDVASIDVAYMEVPCCSGLVRLVRAALAGSGKETPLHLIKIGIGGDVLERTSAVAPRA